MKQKLINYGFWFATEGVNNCTDAKHIGPYLRSIPEEHLPCKIKGLGDSFNHSRRVLATR